jgi:1-deoxy-D-xylulose-5-phosphate reductoisomerase
VAVAAFLDGRIPFPRIWETVAAVMAGHALVAEPKLDDILEADREARAAAEGFVSPR